MTRTAIASMLFLAACPSEPDPAEFVRIDGPAPLITEVNVPVDQIATVVNLSNEFELIVADIRFEPDDPALSWTSSTDWTLPPGGSGDFTVRYRPTEVGVQTGSVVVTTSWGDTSAPLTLEAIPGTDVDDDGFTAADGDCNDMDPDTYPDAPEACDGEDNDCDTFVDEDFDRDRDGFFDEDLCPADIGTDCNDNDRTAFPGNVEECDGTDSDCNGVPDDIDIPADLQDGVCAGAIKRCTAGGPVEPVYALIEGYEATEFTCDTLDNDCDGGVDDFDRLADGTSDCVDDDGDGEREVDGDCDDADKSRTSSTCGPGKIAITRNDDGYATIDLNTGTVELVALGVPTYHGVATSPTDLWFAARENGVLVRHDRLNDTVIRTARFEASPWALETSPSGDLWVLFLDGRFQRRDSSFGGYISEVALSGNPTAWTKAPDDTLWICTAGGDLLHASGTALLKTLELSANCYGPPALWGSRLVLPATDTLVEIDTGTYATVRTRATRKASVRANWVTGDLYVSSGADYTVEVFEGSDLLQADTITLDGQTQGLWYDPLRGLLWLAVFGSDEVVAIDPSTNTVKLRLPVPEPIYIFPMLPE